MWSGDSLRVCSASVIGNLLPRWAFERGIANAPKPPRSIDWTSQVEKMPTRADNV